MHNRTTSNISSDSTSHHLTPIKDTPRYTPDKAVAKASSHKFVFTSALHRFKNHNELAHGEISFLSNGSRLMSLVILVNKIRGDYIQRMKIFIDAALKPDQQRDEITRVLKAGLSTNSKDTYKTYDALLECTNFQIMIATIRNSRRRLCPRIYATL